MENHCDELIPNSDEHFGGKEIESLEIWFSRKKMEIGTRTWMVILGKQYVVGTYGVLQHGSI